MTQISIGNSYSDIYRGQKLTNRQRIKLVMSDSATVKTQIQGTVPKKIGLNPDDAEQLEKITKDITSIIDRLSSLIIEAADVKESAYKGLCGLTASKIFTGFIIVVIFVQTGTSIVLSIIYKIVNDPDTNCVPDWAVWSKMCLEIITALTICLGGVVSAVHEYRALQADTNTVLKNNGILLKEANKLLKLALETIKLIQVNDPVKQKLLVDSVDSVKLLQEKESTNQELLKNCVEKVKDLSPETKSSLPPENFIPTLAMKYLNPTHPLITAMNKINDRSLQLNGQTTQKVDTPKEGSNPLGEESGLNLEEGSVKVFTEIKDKKTLSEEFKSAVKDFNTELSLLGWDTKHNPFKTIRCGDHCISVRDASRTKIEETLRTNVTMIKV